MKGISEVKGVSKVDLRMVLLLQCEEKGLYDVTLAIGMEHIHAHRCVLAAMSPYFKAMFTGGFREKDEKVVDMSATFQSKEPLQDIIHFMYGGELHVTKENVEEYLKGSSFFQIPELTLLCLEFLLINLRVDNCLWMGTLADIYGFDELFLKCSAIAVSVFPEVLQKRKRTLNVPVTTMLRFLQNGLCSRCKHQDKKTFLDDYAQAQKADKKKKDLLYASAELDISDGFAVQSSTHKSRKQFLSSSEKSCASPLNFEVDSVTSGGRPAQMQAKREASTTLLCWSHYTPHPSMKFSFVFYSVEMDKWYIYKLDDTKLPHRNFCSTYKLVGYTKVINKSDLTEAGGLVCRCDIDKSFFLIELPAGSHRPLPAVCNFPAGFPKDKMENIHKGTVTGKEVLDAFCLGEKIYLINQFMVYQDHPSLPNSTELYVAYLDENSETWKYVSSIQQLNGISRIQCKTAKVTDHEAFIITMQTEDIQVYRLSCSEKHGEVAGPFLACVNKVSFEDTDKFDQIARRKASDMYYEAVDYHFDIFPVGQEIYINVKCGTVSYNPVTNKFERPTKQFTGKTSNPVAMEKWGLEKYGANIYSPDKETNCHIASNIPNVHFMVEEDMRSPDHISKKCPIIGKYGFLLRERPEILHVRERFLSILTLLSPADYSEPLLTDGDTSKALEEYQTRVKPLAELVLEKEKHAIDDEGKCFSCACMNVDDSSDFSDIMSDSRDYN